MSKNQEKEALFKKSGSAKRKAKKAKNIPTDGKLSNENFDVSTSEKMHAVLSPVLKKLYQVAQESGNGAVLTIVGGNDPPEINSKDCLEYKNLKHENDSVLGFYTKCVELWMKKYVLTTGIDKKCNIIQGRFATPVIGGSIDSPKLQYLMITQPDDQPPQKQELNPTRLASWHAFWNLLSAPTSA